MAQLCAVTSSSIRRVFQSEPADHCSIVQSKVPTISPKAAVASKREVRFVSAGLFNAAPRIDSGDHNIVQEKARRIAVVCSWLRAPCYRGSIMYDGKKSAAVTVRISGYAARAGAGLSSGPIGPGSKTALRKRRRGSRRPSASIWRHADQSKLDRLTLNLRNITAQKISDLLDALTVGERAPQILDCPFAPWRVGIEVHSTPPGQAICSRLVTSKHEPVIRRNESADLGICACRAFLLRGTTS